MTGAGVHEIAIPDVLSIQWPADRPIIIVDNGADTTSKLVNSLQATTVVLSFGSVSGVPTSKVVVLSDRSEASISRALSDITSGGQFWRIFVPT